MTAKYFLVTDATAAEVERRTGLRGIDTPFGVLVERVTPFDVQRAMAEVDRALYPTRCTCGRVVAFHRPNCPAAGAVV